jgi:hypothetical protein
MRWALLFTAALAASAGAATQAPQRQTFRTAQWEMTATLVSLEAPTLPESAQQQFRRMIEAIGGRQCVGGTTDDLVRDLRDGIVQGFRTSSPGSSCTFSDSDAASNGLIRTQATCRAPNSPVESRVSLAGTYTDASIEADVEMTFVLPNDPPERPTARIRAHVSARAGGPCGPQA